MIAARDELGMIEIKDHSTCEVTWVEIQSNAHPSIIVGAFYRPGWTKISTLKELKTSLEQLPNPYTEHIILAGDFNLPSINWTTSTYITGGKDKELCEELIAIAQDNGLEQIQLSPSREANNLDLFFTSNASLIKECNTLPGISDHDMILADCFFKPSLSIPKRREIFLYKKANWDNIKYDMKKLNNTILEEIGTGKYTIEEIWEKLKSGINDSVKQHVPSRKSRKNNNLPWVNRNLEKEIKKKRKLHSKYKNIGSEKALHEYKEQRKKTKRLIRKAHWGYLNVVFEKAMSSGNNKPFWKYVKTRRTDVVVIAPIKKDGQLYYAAKEKAEKLNSQFKSVFNKQILPLPQIAENIFPTIEELKIKSNGVKNLLSKFNPNKACGPDGLPTVVLKQCHEELAPAVAAVFQKSLHDGMLPNDWRDAYSMYAQSSKREVDIMQQTTRPISLTSITCKTMEHIVCRHLLNHLEKPWNPN